MKFSLIKFTAIPVLALGILPGCTKHSDGVLEDNSDFTNSSRAQVYVATLNATRNYVYVDGLPVNGSPMTTGALFPASGPGFKVAPGIKAFLVRDTLTATTQVPLSFAENLQFDRNYTVFLYDSITTPKQKTVQTDIVIPSDTTARLRFANFVYSPTAIPTAFDIFSVKKNANIFTNVQLTDVTGFIPVPSGITDTFYIRPTGTTTNLQNINPTPAPGTAVNIQATLNPTAKRSYTLIFRGGYRSTFTNITTVRGLSVFANY